MNFRVTADSEIRKCPSVVDRASFTGYGPEMPKSSTQVANGEHRRSTGCSMPAEVAEGLDAVSGHVPLSDVVLFSMRVSGFERVEVKNSVR
jgi:hypothetical protein